MDDIIFEKDYRETESAEYDKWCDEVFDRAVNCGMLKAYSEAMDKIPKIIVPEDKKNYEYLLERCDAFVKQHRGYIKGIVDYHRWHAEINMFLPFAEFDDSEDLAFLKEIAEKSQTVCFSPDEEGGIRVHIFINYFEELMSAEHKSYIEYDAIMQDKKLSELLGIPELSDEEKELALKMKGILDRIDDETRIDRTTAFRAVLDKMTKEPEENWSLHYMATLLEALLYFMLNEGNEKIDEEVEKLQSKFQKDNDSIENKLSNLYEKLEREEQQATATTTDTLISIGTTLLGAFFGKSVLTKTNMGKVASSAKGASRILKERNDIKYVEADILQLQEEQKALQDNLENEIEKINTSNLSSNYEIEEIFIKPKRSDIYNIKLELLWKEQ